jgi:hypothetical protein
MDPNWAVSSDTIYGGCYFSRRWKPGFFGNVKGRKKLFETGFVQDEGNLYVRIARRLFRRVVRTYRLPHTQALLALPVAKRNVFCFVSPNGYGAVVYQALGL